MENKGKAFFYVIAGGYLLYLAYKLFGVRMDNGGKDYALMMIFSVLFAIVGVAILVYTGIMYVKMIKKDQEDPIEQNQEK